jgi:hypothetical protein
MIWEKISRGLKSLLDFDDEGGLLDFDVDDVRLRSSILRPCLLGPLLVLLDPVAPDGGVGITSRRRPAMVAVLFVGRFLVCVLLRTYSMISTVIGYGAVVGFNVGD